MKVVLPKEKPNVQPPPIPFEKVEKQLQKGEYMVCKLHTDGADPQSATREIHVPYFKDGSPEELLVFLKLFDKVVQGQNLTTGPQKYAMMKDLLKGHALSYWNHQATAVGTETNQNFELMKKYLIFKIFPRRALRLQKRYLRRYLRKPRDVQMRSVHTRVVELNDYLESFPNGKTNDQGVPLGFSANQKLDDDELADILEYGCPGSWQRKMISHGFDPIEEDDPIEGLVQFCERMETVEGMEANLNPKQSSNNNKSSRKRKTPDDSGDGSSKYDPTKFCRYHGPGHDTGKCRKLLELADKMKQEGANRSSNDYRKRSDYATDYKKSMEKQMKALLANQNKIFTMLSAGMQTSPRKRKQAAMAALLPTNPTASESDSDNGEACAAFEQKFSELSVASGPSDESSDSDGDLYA